MLHKTIDIQMVIAVGLNASAVILSSKQEDIILPDYEGAGYNVDNMGIEYPTEVGIYEWIGKLKYPVDLGGYALDDTAEYMQTSCLVVAWPHTWPTEENLDLTPQDIADANEQSILDQFGE